jgi:putative methionine-R-sulfoxide reductase with GAF domain
VLRGIEDTLASDLGRAEQAVQIAELVRQAGSYRWVGLYAVTDQEITAIGWSGPGAPAHPRFPVTQGLSGAAAATGRAVVVNDVTADPGYLTAFAVTLSEAIVPVVDPGTGAVVGTLDVETPSGTPLLTPTARRWLGAPPRSGGCLQQRGRRSPVGNVTVGGEGGHPSGTGPCLADQTVDDRDQAGQREPERIPDTVAARTSRRLPVAPRTCSWLMGGTHDRIGSET